MLWSIYKYPSTNDQKNILVKLTDKGKEQREIYKQLIFKVNKTIENNSTQNTRLYRNHRSHPIFN